MTIAVRSEKVQDTMKQNANMMALHNGSRVFVRKDDILKIFCDKPALYAVRLAAMVFGEDTLQRSCMPDETNSKYVPLDEEVLDSIISKLEVFIEEFSLKLFFKLYSTRHSGLQTTKQSRFSSNGQKFDSNALEQIS
jgi:hypothetical protein